MLDCQNFTPEKPNSLYPERPSDLAPKIVSRLKELAEGKGRLELSPSEKEHLLKWEGALSKKTEKLTELIKETSHSLLLFYPAYFLAEEGQEKLKKILQENFDKNLTKPVISVKYKEFKCFSIQIIFINI